MINICICDDNIAICNDLLSHIKKYFLENYKNIDIDVKIFMTSKDFLMYKNIKKFDLIFLDIEIDENSGIDIAKIIREDFKYNDINLVFISGYKDYALDLFRLRPIDFLIKPINNQSLYSLLDLFMNLQKKENYIFKYKVKTTINLIDIKNILFFESIGRKIKVVTNTNEDIFYGNLKSINKELENFNFIQTHNSFLVNIKYITKITNSELFILDNIRIPISRSNKNKILKIYMEN
nr:LytTR family DNA-binding domain-containing protein [uncultured Tyzzerella sp.]